MIRADRLRTVRRMTATGRSAREIAEIIGVSERTVVRDRRRLGIPPTRRPIPRSTEDWAVARALLDDGCSYIEVERTTGISETTLRRRFPGLGWSRSQAAAIRRILRHPHYTRTPA